MTSQHKSSYYDSYHEQLNKYAALSGQGINDKLVYRLLMSYINSALQGLESGGIIQADFTTNFITEVQFKEIYSQLYSNTGIHFAEWQYNKIASMKKANRNIPVGFFSEMFNIIIGQILSGPDFTSRIRQVTEETRNQIKQLLNEANTLRLDLRGTAKLIREKVPLIGKYRSLLISRTETTLAASMGARYGAQKTNLELNKVWLATKSGNTRDAHRSMLSSTPVGMDEKFIVGGKEMMHPGDPAGGPENCCNCRCCVAYVPVGYEFN